MSLVLRELGQPARVQWAGTIIAFTVPMAILQASGAQTDLVVSLWLLGFLFYLWRTMSDRSWQSPIFCGLALGLALATKGTAYLYAPAMGAALVVCYKATTQWGRRLPVRGLVVALARAGERQTVDGVEYARVQDFGELSILRRVTDLAPTRRESRGPPPVRSGAQ